MAVTILPQNPAPIIHQPLPTWGQTIAGGLGTGLGEGLSILADQKYKEMLQKKQKAANMEVLKPLFKPEHQRWAEVLASMPQEKWPTVWEGLAGSDVWAAGPKRAMQQQGAQAYPMRVGGDMMPQQEPMGAPRTPTGMEMLSSMAGGQGLGQQQFFPGQQNYQQFPMQQAPQMPEVPPQLADQQMQEQPMPPMGGEQEPGWQPYGGSHQRRAADLEIKKKNLELKNLQIEEKKQEAIRKRNLPFTKGLQEGVIRSRKMDSDLDEYERILRTGNINDPAVIAAFEDHKIPRTALTADTQLLLSLGDAIANNMDALKGNPSFKRIQWVRGQKVDVKMKREAQFERIRQLRELNQEGYDLSDTVKEIQDELGGNEPDNLYNVAFKRYDEKNKSTEAVQKKIDTIMTRHKNDPDYDPRKFDGQSGDLEGIPVKSQGGRWIPL